MSWFRSIKPELNARQEIKARAFARWLLIKQSALASYLGKLTSSWSVRRWRLTLLAFVLLAGMYLLWLLLVSLGISIF